MPNKPLNLFICPSFQPADAPPGSWQKLYGYGDVLSEAWQRLGMRQRAELVLLEANQTDAGLYAAATGFLSTRYPDNHIPAPSEAVLPADTGQADPDSINVYLHPRPFLDMYPGFRSRAEELFVDPLSLPDDSLGLFQPPPGVISGFLYLNVDTQHLKAILQSRQTLDELVEAVTSLRLEATTLPPATTEQSFDQQWRLFLEGKIDIFVRGGEEFGAAAAPLVASTDPNARQTGFAVLTSEGTADPARFYDWLRDFVVEAAAVDDLLALVAPNWPLIDPNLSTTDLINLSSAEILPFSELERIRLNQSLTPGQWRLIGNYQKALYRERLLKRVGLAPADSIAPVFEFNDYEWRNIFQLEAVVEFYANFADPWDILEEPQTPKLAGGSDNPEYTTVDLLPLNGQSATVSGNRVTLDGEPDLSRIWPGRDAIYLQWDSARSSRLYTILAVNAAAKTVIVDGEPSLSPIASTSWHIKTRPTLILIDGFGGRTAGSQASVQQTAPVTKIKLDDGVNLETINRSGFDTIYFHNDTAAYFRPRTYPIVDADNAAKTVTVEGIPDFGNGLSTWHIPAGIGGRLPDLAYNLGRNAARGWDHYDGLLFVVQHGVVQDRYRWTSYTSHTYNPATAAGLGQRSSVRGNQRYPIRSYRSANDYRNFSFKVVDGPGHLMGYRAAGSATAANQLILDGEPDLSLITHTGPTGQRDSIVLFTDTNRADKTYRIDGVDNSGKILTLDGNPLLPDNISGWTIVYRDYDGVRDNRHYFEATVTADSAPPGAKPAYPGAGKTEIRLHYGNMNSNDGSGSAGCMVSPLYFQMRNRLIELYQEEWVATHGAGTFDPDVDEVYGLKTLADHQAPGVFNGILAGQWNDKIVGALWLIRPDERPLG